MIAALRNLCIQSLCYSRSGAPSLSVEGISAFMKPLLFLLMGFLLLWERRTTTSYCKTARSLSYPHARSLISLEVNIIVYLWHVFLNVIMWWRHVSHRLIVWDHLCERRSVELHNIIKRPGRMCKHSLLVLFVKLTL